MPGWSMRRMAVGFLDLAVVWPSRRDRTGGDPRTLTYRAVPTLAHPSVKTWPAMLTETR